MTRFVLVLHTALFVTSCNGFAFFLNKAENKVPNNLKDLVPQVDSSKLNFRVAVGEKENPFQMKDMVVELNSIPRGSKKSSTGVHKATLVQSPNFINDEGEQIVALKEGGWEIRWVAKSPHGHLTCSFVSADDVKRTKDGATLEAGRFFLNHRVWTRETLESERDRRRKIQSEAAQYIDTRDQKIKEITEGDDTRNKMNDEAGLNIGSKVVSYAQAAQSMRNYYTSGYQETLYIPLYDDQVLELAPDLILSTRGEIFKVNSRGRPERIGLSRVDVFSSKSSE